MKHILAFCWLLAVSLSVFAGNFTVNNIAQFQAALITASANGQNDTINVMAGTYNVNPVLTYSSSENYSILIRGIGSPILDGGGTRQIMLLSTSASGGDIIIYGLTIRNGRADYGGGLNISTQGADIGLYGSIISDNTANFVAGGVNLFSNTGNITVNGCSFSRNTSPNTSGYPYGTAGGLFIQTDGSSTVITLTSCIFGDNSAQRDAAGAMLYPLGSGSRVIVENNSFIDNTAREAGGGCWIRGPGGSTTVIYSYNNLYGNSTTVAGSGGGTYIQIASGSITLFNNSHIGNSSVWQGGGLWIEHSGGTMNIFRNRFTNNTSGESGGGANIFLESGTVKLYQNVFNKNVTSGPGGGLNFSTTSGRIVIFNNTFYSNRSADGGDVNVYFDNSSSSCSFFNNILYNSSQPAITYSGMQTVIARYSDIKGGTGQLWFGTGCIDKFPFFSDTATGDFHLQDSIHCSDPRYSPCIDAGDPVIWDSTLDCSWGLGIIRSDMGAYGGGDTITIGINILHTGIPEEYQLFQNYPNPFNPTTRFGFRIADLGLVRFTIFDAVGKEVQVLVNQELSPGTYEIDFDGSALPSGVYYYTFKAGEFTQTKKMVLIK